MYKIKLECSKAPCNVIVSSQEEIKELENNGAKITILESLDTKGELTHTQISRMIDVINSIPSVKKYDNNCYMNSLLFTLFSFPTKFVENNIINVDISKIRSNLRNNKRLSEEDINKVIKYIELVHKTLLDIISNTGNIKEKYCKKLSLILLKTPIDILESNNKSYFNKPQNIEEVLRAIFNIFYISNVDKVEETLYLNSTDSKITNTVTTLLDSLVPIYTINPKESIRLEKETKIILDESNYIVDENKKPADIEVLKRIEDLRGIQTISMITSIVIVIFNHDKEYIFNCLKNTKYKDVPEDIKNKKQLYLVKRYTLDELIECYQLLKALSGNFYNTTVLGELEKVKQNPSLKYYQSQQEINKLIKYYYDIIIKKEYYRFNGDAYIVINIKRFLENSLKDTTPILLSETLKVDKATLDLKYIISHNGACLKTGHYITTFKSFNLWYKYDSVSNNITKLGKFEEMLKLDNDFYLKNCILLVYY